jgi:hypothetical protein
LKFFPTTSGGRDHRLNLSISIRRGKETNGDSLSSGERSGKSSSLKSAPGRSCKLKRRPPGRGPGSTSLEQEVVEGENPVRGPEPSLECGAFLESGCLGMQLKTGGKLHLKLNTGERPIANK